MPIMACLLARRLVKPPRAVVLAKNSCSRYSICSDGDNCSGFIVVNDVASISCEFYEKYTLGHTAPFPSCLD